MCSRRNVRGLVSSAKGLLWFSVCLLACRFPTVAVAQSSPPSSVQGNEVPATDASAHSGSASELKSNPQSSGYINGTVLDRAGAVAVGARLRLTRDDQSPAQEVLSGSNGQFSFANLPPGPFEITVISEGFQNKSVTGVLAPGEVYIVPEIRLSIATVVTEVRVSMTQIEVAQEQLRDQEKQRVLGFIPNFYVSYVPDAAPLSTKQKFQLAWKSTIDPFTIVGAAALAGIEQGTDDFSGYGQGMEGYAKRFGAAYADVVSGTFIGSAILPSVLKQDPRYFYKGTGSAGSRILYAMGGTVICKGDNKRWQPNYSWVLGSFATGGLSYLYYPANERDVVGLVVQNSLIRIGEGAFENVLQEFVIRKFTPHLQRHPTN